MEPTTQTDDNSLTVTRTFRATPEELWELWTDPEKISQWHRPNDADFTTKADADARVGGSYKLVMTNPRGTQVAFGEFQELDRPRKLVYSWKWQDGHPFQEDSRVTILLEAVPDGTKLTLVHDRLSGPESVRAHAEGWTAIVENINSIIS